ncbi:MAG: hypothetical protein ACP5VE_14940 [Chthonomonadales bacterium]
MAAMRLLTARGDLGVRAALACILLAPLVWATAAHRRRIVVREGGMADLHLFGSRWVPWEAILCVDVRRRGVVIRTSTGCVATGWIGAREELCRQLVDRAGLKRAWGGLPGGVLARYLPAGAFRDGDFLPHNLRSRRNPPTEASGEDGRVV